MIARTTTSDGHERSDGKVKTMMGILDATMAARLRTAMLMAVMTATAVGARAQAPEPAPGPNPEPGPAVQSRDVNYTAGLKAMDEGRWSDAVSAFDKSAAATPSNPEAALYWKAYSLLKLGRKSDATATCGQVIAANDKSSWKQECAVLNAQSNSTDLREMERTAERLQRDEERANRVAKIRTDVNVRLGDLNVDGKREPIDPDDELKMIALSSLMRNEPDKALPLLHGIIFSSKPLELRRRALFVLAQNKSPEAQAMLVEAAKNNNDIELQRLAVQMMGIHGKTYASQLKTIYLSSSDTRVKRAAISGMFTSGDATDMVELAKSEKDIALKRELVSQLSVMKDPAATAYMEELLK
jgi:tetratricopeptide (TPR) repeat protein